MVLSKTCSSVFRATTAVDRGMAGFIKYSVSNALVNGDDRQQYRHRVNRNPNLNVFEHRGRPRHHRLQLTGIGAAAPIATLHGQCTAQVLLPGALPPPALPVSMQLENTCI